MIKEILIVFIITSLFLIWGCRNMGKDIKSFAIYYGHIDDKVTEKLLQYPLIILEPKNTTKEEISRLQESGVKVYGYISIIEQNENDTEFSSLRNSWFYTPQGEKIRIPQWESWYMDIRNKGYQAYLFQQIYSRIIEKNMDGILLDTVGDIDDSGWKESDKVEMREAYKELLLKVHENYSELEMIQNWGFETAKDYSGEIIDGIMWESFSFNLLESDPWVRDRFNEIKDMGIDFYIVTPNSKEIKDNPLQNTLYIYQRGGDYYDDLEPLNGDK